MPTNKLTLSYPSIARFPLSEDPQNIGEKEEVSSSPSDLEGDNEGISDFDEKLSLIQNMAKEFTTSGEIYRNPEAFKTLKEKVKEILPNSSLNEDQKIIIDNFKQSILGLRSVKLSQNRIIDKLFEFLNLRNPERPMTRQGLCHGLTFLYCYYQFKNEEHIFSKRIVEVLETDPSHFSENLKDKRWDELSEKEKNFEHLCNDLFYLQASKNLSYPEASQKKFLENLKFVSDEAVIRDLSLQIDYKMRYFSSNEIARKLPGLQKTLLKIFSRETNKYKFLKLGITLPSKKLHIIGIFYKKNTCYVFDPNHRPKAFSLDPHNLHSSIEDVVKFISKKQKDKAFYLKMSVIS